MKAFTNHCVRSCAGFFQITNPNASGRTKATGAEFNLEATAQPRAIPKAMERPKYGCFMNVVMREKNVWGCEPASATGDSEFGFSPPLIRTALDSRFTRLTLTAK